MRNGPTTISALNKLVQEHGILCDSQAEYERQVARYLFGYSDVKDFEKLINLLLVLRRPNLSTELNFSRVHDYLQNVAAQDLKRNNLARHRDD